MKNAMLPVRNPRLLGLAVYLIVAIMVVISFISIPDATTKAAAITLCVAFGLVHAFGFRSADTPGRLALYFVAQTILILSLLRLISPGDLYNFLFYILALVVLSP